MKDLINYADIRLDRKMRSSMLFMQLANELERLIGLKSEEDEVGLLPARSLAQILGVNRITIGKAYKVLESRGVIEHSSERLFRVSQAYYRKNINPFQSIGIVLPRPFSLLTEQGNGITLQYLKGIIDAASERHISTLMLELPPLSASREKIAGFNQTITQRLLGLIHLGDRKHFPDHPLEAVLKNSQLPQIMIDAHPEESHIGAVNFDIEPGVYALADQICTLRHKKIGFLSLYPGIEQVSPSRYYHYASNERVKEFYRIFRKYDLKCDEVNCGFNCRNYDTTCKALQKLIDNGKMPTVLCCMNDAIANWCITALKKMGLRVPEDVSVTGFDGLSLFSGQLDELTTIGVPFYSIGRTVVKTLLDYQKNGISDDNRIVMLKTFLVLRKTLINPPNITFGNYTKEVSKHQTMEELK